MAEKFSGEGEQFLHEKYPELHKTEPIEKTSQRLRGRGEKVSQKPADKISAYLERFQDVLNPEPLEGAPDFDRKQRNIDFLRNRLYQDVIIKPEEIPQGYWNSQAEIMIREGRGADLEQAGIRKQEYTDKNGQKRTDYIFPGNLREQQTEAIIKDQKATLDNWIDYLTSPDSDVYPMWLKYWVFTSVLKLSTYDKEKHAFGKRGEGTAAPFPDLNREALAYVVDAIAKKVKKKNIPEAVDNPELQKLLQGANFGKLYAYAIEKVTPTAESELANIEGKWVKYPQGSDHIPLVESIQGHSTGWCIAGETIAKTYLETGDFYVFYSLDRKGRPTIPRVAIKMEGQDKIAQVRGIAPEQNLDPYIGSVVEKKLKDFGREGEAYQERLADMKLLTAIQEKQAAGRELTREELRFLYELDAPIQGFGYQKDPRIEKIRSQRKLEQDLPIIFECQPGQIALSKEQIRQDTVAYIGEWTLEVLEIMPESVKYIYEKFPDRKVFFRTIETNPEIKDKQTALTALKKQGFETSDWAKDMLEKTEYSKEKQEFQIVSFSVESLGFTEGAEYKDIIARAKQLGLELCPAELGPQIRLKYNDQPENEWLYLAMNPIAQAGFESVFDLCRGRSGLWLGRDFGGPESFWNPEDQFLFVRPRKHLREPLDT